MRQGIVKYNNHLTGTITETNESTFVYISDLQGYKRFNFLLLYARLLLFGAYKRRYIHFETP